MPLYAGRGNQTLSYQMNTQNKQVILLTTLVLIFMLAACSGIKDISSLSGLNKSNCYNQKDYHYTSDELPKPIYQIKVDTILSKQFSFESLNVANAIGLLQPLTKYAALQSVYDKTPNLDLKVNLLEIRQTITDKINTSSLEISSVASELDCEEERADQIANYLKSRVEEREKNLVIGSIVVGAAGAIAAEGLNNSESVGNAGSYVAVGASLIEATLGILMLTNKQKINFVHPRNTPGEIWNAPPTSSTLPPAIWYYLNYKDDDKRKESLRELLIENWTTFGQVEKSNKQANHKTDELYFGKGGEYSSEELKNRADMYDQIEAYINLMKQDLKMLSIEFEKITAVL